MGGRQPWQRELWNNIDLFNFATGISWQNSLWLTSIPWPWHSSPSSSVTQVTQQLSACFCRHKKPRHVMLFQLPETEKGTGRDLLQCWHTATITLPFGLPVTFPTETDKYHHYVSISHRDWQVSSLRLHCFTLLRTYLGTHQNTELLVTCKPDQIIYHMWWTLSDLN